MKAAVIVFPGSNCDRDVAVALNQATGKPTQMIWHRETALPTLDLIVIPGGFSYGDYLRSGAMAAHSPIMQAVKAQADRGVMVLAICNGFQIVTEAGLLPGVLMPNAGQKFICKDVHLKVERNDTAFTRQYKAGQIVRFPIAHHDGNYFCDPDTLKRLEGDGLVAFRYASADGQIAPHSNPNGSLNNIAGIYNDRKNVMALMPHPERLIDPALGGTDGIAMFRALVETLS